MGWAWPRTIRKRLNGTGKPLRLATIPPGRVSRGCKRIPNHDRDVRGIFGCGLRLRACQSLRTGSRHRLELVLKPPRSFPYKGYSAAFACSLLAF